MFSNGKVGDRAKPEDRRVLTDDELLAAGTILEERIAQRAHSLASIADFGSFIWGWKNLSGAEAVKRWISAYAVDDRPFLAFLVELRGWAISDRVYYPLRRSAVEAFFDYDEVIARMDTIHASGDSELMAEVEQLRISLRQGKDHD